MLKFCWSLHGQKLWRHSVILTRPGVANFAEITKITVALINTKEKSEKSLTWQLQLN